MQSPHEVTEETVRALAAYVESLPPPPPLDVARGTVDAAAVARGRRIFREEGCIECHSPPTYTSPDTYDVGLKDESGNQRFNPPTLRGVSQRDRWLHDGRAARLDDIFTRWRHGLEQPLDHGQLADLLAFLRQL